MSDFTLDEQAELLMGMPSWRHPRKPPTAYDAKRLRSLLLKDHQMHRDENPGWVAGAVVRIAQLERKSIEAVSQELGEQTRELTGVSMFAQGIVNPMAQ